MKDTTVQQSDDILEVEKSYQEQLAKIGKPGYDSVLTSLLAKELDRLRRKIASPHTEYPLSPKKYKRVLAN
jgi:hypothetical protein